MNDNLIAVIIFSVFILAPFLSVAYEKFTDSAKEKINDRLKPHGLRLKQRG